MVNTAPTQLSRNALPRRDRSANVEQLLRGVGQDNPTPPPARAASPQPAPPKKDMRPTPKETNTARTQQGKALRRKTVHLTIWVRPVVKAELGRIAESEGVSVSATGAAFLEKALQHNLHSQHTTLLDLTISRAIGKHMRSYSTRIAVLLVRSIFASEQARSLVTNILSRHPGVTQDMLTRILNGSSNAAKRNITRKTPQLETIINEVEQWFTQAQIQPYE